MLEVTRRRFFGLLGGVVAAAVAPPIHILPPVGGWDTFGIRWPRCQGGQATSEEDALFQAAYNFYTKLPWAKDPGALLWGLKCQRSSRTGHVWHEAVSLSGSIRRRLPSSVDFRFGKA